MHNIRVSFPIIAEWEVRQAILTTLAGCCMCVCNIYGVMQSHKSTFYTPNSKRDNLYSKVLSLIHLYQQYVCFQYILLLISQLLRACTTCKHWLIKQPPFHILCIHTHKHHKKGV